MITVNRRHKLPWQEGMTVEDVLARMAYTYPRIIVRINDVLIPHDAYAETILPDGADVQVIHLMAGG